MSRMIHHLECTRRPSRIPQRFIWSFSLALSGLSACSPGDLLDVPPPANVTAVGDLHNQSGAELLFDGAHAKFARGFSGEYQFLPWNSVLTDEYTWSALQGEWGTHRVNIDARSTTRVPNAFDEVGDDGLQAMLAARSVLLIAVDGLKQYEPASGHAKIGEALALVGYTELLMAESYCAGVPLSHAAPDGGAVFEHPLSTDSLLGTAIAHFDSAVVYAGVNDTIHALASVGLARAWLARGDYVRAAAAVAGVPTSFHYDAQLQPTYSGSPGYINNYSAQLSMTGNCGYLSISDREGGNGLNFRSANDPRLVIDSTSTTTCDGGVFYYPAKFGVPSTTIPLATGVEARLIEAEAALQNNDPDAWASTLNTLRASAPATYLNLAAAVPVLITDSTTAATSDRQVDVMFRERAFWLFGTGTRLGDMRRLIRQYHRDANTVFPSGTYPNGNNLPVPLPTYGTDVSLTLPVAGTTQNPYYQGCLTPPSTP